MQVSSEDRAHRRSVTTDVFSDRDSSVSYKQVGFAFGVVLVAAKWKASYAVKIKETFEHQPVFLFSFREEKDPWVCEDRRAKAVVW